MWTFRQPSPLWDARQRDVKHVVLTKHVVDHLVHVGQLVAAVREVYAHLTIPGQGQRSWVNHKTSGRMYMYMHSFRFG